MSNKQEILSQFYNMPANEICCKNCDRRVNESKERSYCIWLKAFPKDIESDVCKYFLNTQYHK